MLTRVNFFSYERKIVYGVILFYIISSQFLIPKNNWQEVFPFFHWSLFSSLDSNFTYFQIKLKNKESLNSSYECLLSDCKLAAPGLRTKRLFFLIQDIGAALKYMPNEIDSIKNKITQLEQQLKKFEIKGSYDLVELSTSSTAFENNEAPMINQIIYSGILQ